MGTKRAAVSGSRRRAARAVGSGKGARGAYFLSLSVENVRCFGPMQTLDLSDGGGRPRRWTVILGNNGVGKTTLLQVLATSTPVEDSTSPPEIAPLLCTARAPTDVFDFRRSQERAMHIHYRIGYGGAFSSSEPVLREEEGDIELEESIVSYSLFDKRTPPAINCFAYGAARRMGASSLSDPGPENPIVTLFRDDVPLRNAEEWLLQADYAANKPSPHQARARVRRDAVKAMLIDLLPEIGDIEILSDLDGNPAYPRPGIRLKTPYGWVPLQGLSLGYKTLLAWMVDLASRLYERYPDSENPLAEPAVVLVDEIDLHLHPAWQRTLLDYLSQRFPNVQFIVTAHSPLVVQAATDANVVVLRREGDHVIIDNGAAAVRSWRVDQILTSDLFGLPSARPPALDALLAERRKILTKPHLSAAERRELERIEQAIGELPAGETPEQMEAMDIIQRAARSLKKAGGGAA